MITNIPSDGSVFLARILNKGYNSKTSTWEPSHYTVQAIVFDRYEDSFPSGELHATFRPHMDCVGANVMTTKVIYAEDIEAIMPVPKELRDQESAIGLGVKWWEGDEDDE